MDNNTDDTTLNNMKTVVSSEIAEDLENKCIKTNPPQKDQNSSALKCTAVKKVKDPEKIKCMNPAINRSSYHRRFLKQPVAKRKSAPIYVHMSNPSAEVVLRERKVEIKDLESQVSYLHNQIKELRIENRTLLDLQTRQEKELRKFKGGIADIPSLLRSHKDEIKAVESNVLSLRRELKDSQRDLKIKSDMILKKDQQLDKHNITIKRNERHLQEVISENKEFKLNNKKFEEENKKLSGGNEELKSKNDRLQKKIQQMTSTILNLEEKLGTADHFKGQLKDDICKLQKKYDELLQSEAALKKSLQIPQTTVSTQTDCLETSSISCMTENSLFELGRSNAKINNAQFKSTKQAVDVNQGDKIESNYHHSVTHNGDVSSADFPSKCGPTINSHVKHKSRKPKKLYLKPMNSTSLAPVTEKRQLLKYSNSDGDYKLLSPNDPKLQNDAYVHKNSSKKTTALTENRRHKYYDTEQSTIDASFVNEQDIIDASFVNGTKCHRHKRMVSNLTVKPNYSKYDWLNSL